MPCTVDETNDGLPLLLTDHFLQLFRIETGRRGGSHEKLSGDVVRLGVSENNKEIENRRRILYSNEGIL